MRWQYDPARGATQAIGAIKNARNQGLGCDPVKGLWEWQILCNVDLMFHRDAREGPRAYLETARTESHQRMDRSTSMIPSIQTTATAARRTHE